MTDKIMAVVALATMVGFLGVVAWKVPEIDLIVVITLVSLLALYDFWQQLRAKHGDGNGQG